MDSRFFNEQIRRSNRNLIWANLVLVFFLALATW